jgi:hypothetical protein
VPASSGFIAPISTVNSSISSASKFATKVVSLTTLTVKGFSVDISVPFEVQFTKL